MAGMGAVFSPIFQMFLGQILSLSVKVETMNMNCKLELGFVFVLASVNLFAKQVLRLVTAIVIRKHKAVSRDLDPMMKNILIY